MVEHLYMAIGFHFKCLIHCSTVNQYRYITVQYINLFLSIRDHCLCRPNAAHANDDTADKEK